MSLNPEKGDFRRTDHRFFFCLPFPDSQIVVIEKGTIIVNQDGIIEAVGSDEEISKKFPGAIFEQDIDGKGKSVLPGLVDAHTHPVWDGDRCHEFAAKLAGATYMDIHKMGGGIGFSVRHTKEASEEHLLELLRQRLARMTQLGTTLAEAKTGYGLEAETELKMLRVLTKAAREAPGGKNSGGSLKKGDESNKSKVTLTEEETISSKIDRESIVDRSSYASSSASSSSSSLSGEKLSSKSKVDLVLNYLIHSIPKGQTSMDATNDVLKVQLPMLEKAMKEGSVDCELVDVFCDKGIFEIEETRQILQAGVELGLEINFHGDELTPIKASELAGEMGALAVSHLEHVSAEGIVALSKRPSVAVLLPTTAYILRLVPPPARQLIAGNVPIALGSDFNPNAHCLSMPMTMNLACVLMRMTMPEALVAATLNAAHSIKRSHSHGSLEPGKVADLLLLNAPSWEHLIYQIVDPPIQTVFKSGCAVYNAPTL